MKMKITENQLIELSKIYNTSGKKELYKILKEKYNVTNTHSILRRMRNKKLVVLEESDNKVTQPVDSIFMTMEELCAPVVPKHVIGSEIVTKDTRAVAMEKLVEELIGDRLLELSKYVTTNSTDRLVVIDKTTLVKDGYQLMIH